MSWGVPKIGTIATVASGDLTLTEPAGIAQDDLMVACIAIRSTVGFANGDWTLLESQLSGDTDATNGIASGEMWACRRGASAPSLVFTRTGGNVGHGRIIAYSGAKGTTLADCRDVESSNTLGAASTTATTGTITTAEANELLVAMLAAGDDLTTSAFDAATDPATASGATDTTTAPTAGTWIERSDAGTGTGADTALATADAIRATAGATGQVQCTVSASARHVMAVSAFKMSTTTTTPQAIAATAVGVAAVTRVMTYVRTLAPVAVGVPTITRLNTFLRTLAPVATGVPTLVKKMFVTQEATAVGVAGLVAASLVTKALDAVAVGAAAMTSLVTTLKTIDATAVGVAALTAALTLGKAVVAVAIGIADLVTLFIPASGGGLIARLRKRTHHRRRR